MRKDLFGPNSRYASTPTVTTTLPDGRQVEHLRRRFIAPAERFEQIGVHRVVEGERLDLISFLYNNDPEQFWRLADANEAMNPDDLEEVGRALRITLPEGIPAPKDE